MKKIVLSIFVLVFILTAQEYATLNIYSVKITNDKSEPASFQLLLDKVKITNFANGDRLSIKILNPKNINVKIRNRSSGYTHSTDFDFGAGSTYFWEFSTLSQFSVKDRYTAIENIKNPELFESESIKYIELDVQIDNLVIKETKNISLTEIDFGKEKEKQDIVVEIPERPQPVGAKEIDDFVNKAFDIYETIKAFSDQIRNINSTLEKLMTVESIVGNPVKEVKKEAMIMQRNVKILINDSQELVKIAPNVLNGATKLKFTKIAAATKNVKSALEAVKWAIVEAGELIKDLPEILLSIVDFEKKNNITDTEVILDDIEDEKSKLSTGKTDSGSSGNVIKVTESELKGLKPEQGQMIFTTDTKKLFIFDGDVFKIVKLDNWE